MAGKKEEPIQIEEIKAPMSPISPLISNVVAVFSQPDMVMLDFGFVAPNYCEPHDLEDSQVARICLPWDSAEALAESLHEVISERKKEKRVRRRAKSKRQKET